jgi:ATP-binding cassette subfamily B protein/ATP-binding cassette subfamily C protein
MSLPLKHYKDLLMQYLKPQWRRALLMVILLLASVGLQLVNPLVLRYFIDTVIAGGSALSMTIAGVIFIGIALTNQAVSVFATYISQNVAWTATNSLRVDLVAHCLGLDMAFHKVHTSGELIERIDGDVNTLSNFFSEFVVHLLMNTILLIGILIVLFFVDWRVGLGLTAFALLALFILLRLRTFAVPFWKANRQMDADFYGFLSERLVGTEDIRANGATSYIMWRFYMVLRKWLPINRKASLAGYSMWTTTLAMFALGDALAFFMGAYLWSTGAITIGTAYLILYYTNLLGQPIEQIRNQLQDLQQAGASIQRVEELLRMKPAIQDCMEPQSIPGGNEGEPLPPGALAVDFDNVSFGYTAGDAILHNITFHLQAGKVLGVLGRTGGGKTSLARLLLRLYDAQQGEIRVRGVPIRMARLRHLRQRVGMVTQDVQLFHATVRDNLTFFNRSIPDKRILEVLADLGLSSWYHSLPEGLDTVLGSDGEGLSAGEAQLLAFTRVFLADPGLVILDEASSRLDPATEQLIERAVNKLLVGRSGIIIAHHLATVARTDEILILEHGRILEYGMREELARNSNSHFYHLLQTGLEEVRV